MFFKLISMTTKSKLWNQFI